MYEKDSSDRSISHRYNNNFYPVDKEATMSDIFNVKDTISVDGKEHAYYSLPKLAETYDNINTLPYCMKVVLENLLRNEDDGQSVGKNHIEARSAARFHRRAISRRFSSDARCSGWAWREGWAD